MTRFIKAYNRGNSTAFEVAVVATNSVSARNRALADLLVRRPSRVSALEDVEVTQLGDGVFKEYRVFIQFSDNGDLRELLKIDDAIKWVEDRL